MFQEPNVETGTVIPMFILWIILSALAIYFVLKKKNSKKVSTILYLISLILGGIILGGIPNAVMPIQLIISNISSGGPLVIIIPMLVMLVLLLVSTIFLGRIFCGYACPLGAVQELVSKVQFKSRVVPENQRSKLKFETSQKTANIIRWIFFGVILLFAAVWSLAILQFVNPFLGFQLFRSPLLMIIIPLVALIVVVVLSFFIYRPWCRFLCPFGAVSSVTSRFSRFKLRRNEKCTNCALCEKICPTQEAFRTSKKGDCYYCNRCVDVCPQDAIDFKS